ncbi:Rad17 cell cycle checkpoint protein-domain-containing protein [Mortierella sp. GBAus27b]|nr:Rad17 cell cycle checkpoint protein-domain-containing protein [Mortierella sp. GBAus27b]
MPPKRKKDESSTAPTRKAPSRDAKTRSAASTASMYKESEAYLESSSDDLSDQITEPEDNIVSASDTENEAEVEDDSEDDVVDLKKKPTRGRSASKGSNSNTNNSKSSKPRKSRTAENEKSRSQKPRPREAASSPTVTRPASTVGKKKAGNVRFTNLRTNLTSPSGSPAPSPPVSRPNVSKDSEDQWAEKYAPMDISDVAVHSAKVASVRDWLTIHTDPFTRSHDTFDTPGGAMLVLSGPSGSGKTAVLKMLAQELGLTVLEWTNSVNPNSIIQRPQTPGNRGERSTTLDEEYIPVMESFLKFFSMAQRFHPLTTSNGLIQSNLSNISQSTSGSRKRNIILIEDLPPLSAFSSRKLFQEAITTFTNSRSNSAVIVIIVSDIFTKQSTELLFPSSGENRDPALTVRTLFPSSVLDKIDSASKGNPRIKQIKFNPIAPTIMKKAVRRLVEKEFRTAREYMPSAEEINQAIEIYDGDIRAVINSLQFLCYLPSTKRRLYREIEKSSIEEQEFLHNSESKVKQGQDSSLGFFHAVAKVLYNRREWGKPREEFDKDLDLIEKLPIEPDLYTLLLHQNYTRHLNQIEECQTAIEYLCVADQFSHSSGTSSNYTQMIQMQPYMTSLAVRGLLFAPKSSGPASINAGGQKKHWWPEYFAMNRTMRSNDQRYSDIAGDLAGEEARGLSAGHICGPGFLPKRVIREELVPMLHKCMAINPYMAIWNTMLRPGSKDFVRNAGHYGKRIGLLKKEFGEGDEGFLEEVAEATPGTEGIVDGAVDGHKMVTGDNQGASAVSGKVGQVQMPKPSTTNEMRDEDPIEDFSD